MRILPPEEWPRLQGTGCEVVKAHATSALGGQVIVEENERGEIIGTAFITTEIRIDGVWVHPAYRNGSTFRRIGRTVMRMAALAKVSCVFATVRNRELGLWLKHTLHAETDEGLSIPVVTHG